MLTEEEKKEAIRLRSEKFKKTPEEKAQLKAAKSAWKKSQRHETKA